MLSKETGGEMKSASLQRDNADAKVLSMTIITV